MKCKECLHCDVCAFAKEIKTDKTVLQTDFKCPDYIDKNSHNKYPIKTVVNNNCEIHSKTSKDYNDLISDIESKAIKEFAEKLKERRGLNQMCIAIVSKNEIDNLVKEMTEDKENV